MVRLSELPNQNSIPGYPKETPWEYIDPFRRQEILGGLTSAKTILAEGGVNLVSGYLHTYPGIPENFITGPVSEVWKEVSRLAADPETKECVANQYKWRIKYLLRLKHDHPELVPPVYDKYLDGVEE